MQFYKKKLHELPFEKIFNICIQENAAYRAADRIEVSPVTLNRYLSELIYKNKPLTFSDLKKISEDEKDEFFKSMNKQLDRLKSETLLGRVQHRLLENENPSFKEPIRKKAKKQKTKKAEQVPVNDLTQTKESEDSLLNPSETFKFNLFSEKELTSDEAMELTNKEANEQIQAQMFHQLENREEQKKYQFLLQDKVSGELTELLDTLNLVCSASNREEAHIHRWCEDALSTIDSAISAFQKKDFDAVLPHRDDYELILAELQKIANSNIPTQAEMTAINFLAVSIRIKLSQQAKPTLR